MEFKKKPALESANKEKFNVLDQNELKNQIQVICRIRPKFIDENYVNYQIQDKKLEIQELNQENEVSSQKSFSFTQMFDQSSSQGQLHSQYVVPLIKSLFEKKHNGLVFTYGVTNSGKTYTVIGNQEAPGILPLTLQTFDKIRTAFLMNKPQIEIDGQTINLRDQFFDEHTYNLSNVSYTFQSLEIYNEEIFDLLANQRTKLQLKEVCDKRWYVKDALEKVIYTDQDCRDLLNKALSNRAMGETTLNSQSSRSHTIFKIEVNFTYTAERYQILKKANICIVDLAGSERSKKAETQGSQLTEACNINKSLLVLGKCLKVMQTETDQQLRIPFRECKLTRLLSEYFSDENKILMVVNVKLTKEDIDETLKVLHYGALSVNVNLLKSKIYEQTASTIQRQIIHPTVLDENQIKQSRRSPFEVIRRAKLLVQKQSNDMQFQQAIQQKYCNELVETAKQYKLKLNQYGQKEAGYFSSFKSEVKLQKSLEKILNEKSKQASIEGERIQEVQPFNTFLEEVQPERKSANIVNQQYEYSNFDEENKQPQAENRQEIYFDDSSLNLERKKSFGSYHRQYITNISQEQIFLGEEQKSPNYDENQYLLQTNLDKIEETSDDSRLITKSDNEAVNQQPTPIFTQLEHSPFSVLPQKEEPQFSELPIEPIEPRSHWLDDYHSQEKEKRQFDQATNTTPYDEMKQKLFSQLYDEDFKKIQEEKEFYKKQVLSKLINDEDIQEVIDKENQQQQSNLEQSAKKLQQKNLEKLASSVNKNALKIIDESDLEHKVSNENDLKTNPKPKAKKKKQKQKKQKK